ncbi:MAG TPA: SAM-dependent chlorinase/fluorinase [Bacteroidales bacterium]|nr:SAM-dependent chlorinase/fluorinase [Bacteroidales bacterium]HPS17011.1 SAM-dependent chlorinase/fluorinase [Bacteroidales bacterium]
MAIITLTTDWGNKDHYTGAVKGALLSLMPDATIVDITHDIPTFDIGPASFVIRNCFKNFPEGTIHIIGINTEASTDSPHTLALYDGHYFIGADNGIFSLIFDHQPEKIIELDITQDSDYFTFSTRDVFVKAAYFISKGENIETMGFEKKSIRELLPLKPVVEANAIKGSVVYIDSYENVITNINEELFREAGKGKSFTVSFRGGYDITEISHAYKDVEPGEKLALFGSSGFLEIAINMGNASSLLGLKLKDSVRIDFEEK